MHITRKHFLETLAGGSAVLLFSGCGGGGYGGTSTPASNCGASIVGNHGHALPIAVADLDSATPKTYDIQGTGDHAHSVTFTVPQLRDLKAGTAVALTSTLSLVSPTTQPHTHSVSVSCVIY